MRTLILKLALIAVSVLVGFEIIFGMIFPTMVVKSGDSYINRWRKFYKEKDEAAIICIGSSRVHRHCNAEVIKNITHLPTEVIAESGAKIDLFERLYDDYLKRNPRPKILLVGIDPTGLDSLIYLPFPEYFFPWINLSDHISEMNEFNLIKYHKSFGYFYFKELYIDMIESPELQQHVDGFLVRDIQWDSTLEGIIKKYPDGFRFKVYEPTLIKIFNFMQREKAAGVQCVGFIAPEYSEVWKYEVNRNSTLQKIFQCADNAHVQVWNFSDSSYKLCFEKSLFYNSQHLNKEGATIFSEDLSDSILKYCFIKK